jgi:hypothetical protein
MAIKTTAVEINEAELNAAEEAAQAETSYVYVHTFRKPFTYEDKTYTRITFDWDKLTGADGLAVENEMMRLGHAVVVPSLSGEYLIRMAARASDPEVGYDMLTAIRLSDTNAIRGAARSFLLKSES